MDEHADQQTSIIFNSDEIGRADSGILASKRDTPVGKLLSLGLAKYLETAGATLSDLLSANSSHIPSGEEEISDIDLDDDPVLDADIADCDIDVLFSLE